MTPSTTLNSIRLALTPLAHQQKNVDDLWQRFGREIRAQRRERRIPLKTFAATMKITATYCSFLESGKRRWSLLRAQKAVSLLNRTGGWPETAHRNKR